MKNAVNWFEIPSKDFDRATKFYSKILSTELHPVEAMGMKMAFLPFDMKSGGTGGAIVHGKGYVPTAKGTLVYLNGGDDLSTILSKVKKAGGVVVLPKTAVGENGFIAHFTDSEGNKVGLHSAK